MLVSKKRLTKTPLLVSILLSFKNEILGETPAVKPTKSQGISSPVSSIMIDFTFPLSSEMISFKLVESLKSI